MNTESSSSTAANASLVGRTLRGKYRVLRRLGVGGWGAVFEAEHEPLRRRVAIKVLHPEILARADHAQRFRREAITASSVDHPAIVQVLDYDRTDDGLEFLVFELLRGESLRERLDRVGRASVDDVLRWFVPVLDALAAAHRAGIVHRDLKPENVHLCSSEVAQAAPAKILDFGIAKHVVREADAIGTLTDAGMFVGTPAYMAPEQIRGDVPVDARADLYAVGVTLYECLAGMHPFPATKLAELVTEILEAPVRPLHRLLDDVPYELSRCIHRLMARDRERRPTDASSVADALRAIVRERERHGRPAAIDAASDPHDEATRIATFDPDRWLGAMEANPRADGSPDLFGPASEVTKLDLPSPERRVDPVPEWRASDASSRPVSNEDDEVDDAPTTFLARPDLPDERSSPPAGPEREPTVAVRSASMPRRMRAAQEVAIDERTTGVLELTIVVLGLVAFAIVLGLVVS